MAHAHWTINLVLGITHSDMIVIIYQAAITSNYRVIVQACRHAKKVYTTLIWWHQCGNVVLHYKSNNKHLVYLFNSQLYCFFYTYIHTYISWHTYGDSQVTVSTICLFGWLIANEDKWPICEASDIIIHFMTCMVNL